jgi:pyrrolysine biosynthesis protein PylC
VLVAVVGGNLQGVEAAYLAGKAGWEVVVIDRKPLVPASGICDRFVQCDVTGEDSLEGLPNGVDLIIPALENETTLACLNEFSLAAGLPFAFDLNAYLISSSKLKSDQFFAGINVPAPRPWPECNFPVVAKPSVGSGSQGVTILDNSEAVQKLIDTSDESWVIQEYVQGPSYSIEVLGLPGDYTSFQVTDLEMDADYDCKRVLAPTELPDRLISKFEKISLNLADQLALKGLMDVEVISHEDTLKVLEIDARLPSQTPSAVFWSMGLNMVEMLGNLFLDQSSPKNITRNAPKGVVYEHIKVSPGTIEVAGEHIMAVTDTLQLHKDFFGADEAITNYAPNRNEWVATLIFCENSREAVRQKRNSVISDLKKRFKADKVLDPDPTRFRVQGSKVQGSEVQGSEVQD